MSHRIRHTARPHPTLSRSSGTRPPTGRFRRLLAAALLLLVAQLSPAQDVLFQTAPPESTGGGISLSAERFSGITFRLTQRARVTGIRTLVYSSQPGSIYTALYYLGNPIAAPDVVDESGLLATALLDAPGGLVTTEIQADVDVILEPGWYSVGFGTGRHGATSGPFQIIVLNTGHPRPPATYGPYSVNTSTGGLTLQGFMPHIAVLGELLPPQNDPTGFRFSTAEDWAWWSSTYSVFSAAEFVAQRFSLTRPARLEQIRLWTGMTGSGTAFAAIFPLDNATAVPPMPDDPQLEQRAVAVATFSSDHLPRALQAPFGDVLLPPGHYALMIGSGRFGTNGQVSIINVADGQLVTGSLRVVAGTWFQVPGFVYAMQLQGRLPEIESDTQMIDFGDVLVDAATSRSVTLRNWREHADLVIGNLQILGPDAAQFVLDDDAADCAEIASGDLCTFTLHYRPQSEGSHTAVLLVESDGWPGSLQIELAGNATPSAWVTPGAGPNGSIQPDTPQLVAQGSTPEFTLLPAEGHHVASVGGTCGGSLDGLVFTTAPVTAHCTVFAQFAINMYAVTYGTDGNGSIAGEAIQEVPHGSSSTAVTAVPFAGFHFLQWSDGRTDNPRVDTNVTGPITVQAWFEINTYTLSYGSAGHGTVQGETLQTVEHGGDGAPVTAVPDTGYHFVRWSDGRTDNPRTDTGVTADIDVLAQLAINTYTVTITSSGPGTVSPSMPQTVEHGSTATLQIAPEPGYTAVVTGSCGGQLDGTTWTTDPVTSDCGLDVTFRAPVEVEILGGSGQQTPVGTPFDLPLRVRVLDLDGQPVDKTEVVFQAPQSGASILPVQATIQTGGDGIATLPVQANGLPGSYTVLARATQWPAAAEVTFHLANRLPDAQLTASIDDDRTHVRYGQIVDYQVQVHNAGPDTVSGIALQVVLDQGVDADAATWQCLTPDSGCTPSGSGTLQDAGLALSSGQSATYLLSVPVLMQSGAHRIRADLAVQGPGLEASAFDTTWLVLFRNGFNSADDDGAQQAPWAPALPTGVFIGPVAGEDMIELDVPPMSSPGIGTFWRSGDGSLSVQAMRYGNSTWLRLVANSPQGDRASAWLAHPEGMTVLLGRFDAMPNAGAFLASGDQLVELPAADARAGH